MLSRLTRIALRYFSTLSHAQSKRSVMSSEDDEILPSQGLSFSSSQNRSSSRGRSNSPQSILRIDLPSRKRARRSTQGKALFRGRSNSPKGDISPVVKTSLKYGPKRLVEQPEYRLVNLAANNIQFRQAHLELPPTVLGVVEKTRIRRQSPGPEPSELNKNTVFRDLDCAMERHIASFLNQAIFAGRHSRRAANIEVSEDVIVTKNVVPIIDQDNPISGPKPDMLWGYGTGNFNNFGPRQLLELDKEARFNRQGLRYPFFVMELKGDGPGGRGSLWVAENQCLGGTACCVEATHKLKRRLQNVEGEDPIDPVVFSVAMTGSEARLFVSWKHDNGVIYMQKVESFLVSEPDSFILFRNRILNILEWGEDRLVDIKFSLDQLLE